MEGKSLLYKYLGGVDGFPLMVGSKDPEDIIKVVKLLQPGLGGSTWRTSPTRSASISWILCVPNARYRSGTMTSRELPVSRWQG